MKNATIGKRIIAGFASVIIIPLVLGVFAYVRLVAIGAHSDEIAKKSIPTIALVARAEKNARVSVEILYKHIGSNDKDDIARLEAELSDARTDNAKVLDQMDKLVTSEKGRELMDKFAALRTANNKIRAQALALSQQATNKAAAYALARSQVDPVNRQYLASLENLKEFVQTDADGRSKSIESAVQSSKIGILTGLGFASLVGMAVAFFIVRGTDKILNRIATAIAEGSSQVASAAGQISSTSQSLAEGSSEQAASLEETSSSLEEMSSLTKHNAEGADNAKKFANQARQAADIGAADMEEMSAAMEAIRTSSSDIAKIIKTIDEIAFQTNILSLNAAVEAARAGEAGMGFAVVAEEVRNLAQRSAQAAKETAAKIEGAIFKTAQGVQISAKVGQNLQDIVSKVRKVDELISEVAAASREQSQGIEQVTDAVNQMDRITQSNAAVAEESASASEELNAQAQALKEAVVQLLALVGSRQKSQSTATTKSEAPARAGMTVDTASQSNGNGKPPSFARKRIQ